MKQCSFHRCHCWKKKKIFKISERSLIYFQQLGFFKVHHGHLGLNLPSAVLCHQTWDPSHSHQEDCALPSSQGKCSQRVLKQSNQIRTDTSCQQGTVRKMVHKSFHTLAAYSPYTPWSPRKRSGAPGKIIQTVFGRARMAQGCCEMYAT